MFDFLDKEHIIVQPGFNRWLVPPAATCCHPVMLWSAVESLWLGAYGSRGKGR